MAADDAELGFSFDDVAAFVVGEHSTALAWGSGNPGVSFGPESGVGSLELGVDWSGQVQRVHSVPRTSPNSSGAEPGIGIGCPSDRLEADVTLRLTSGGGALAERVAARVTVRGASRVELQASIPLEALEGAFRVTLAPGATTRALSLRAAFTEFGLAGELSGAVETNDGESASQSGVVYARFPAENPCNASSLAVPVPLTASGASDLASLLATLRDGERALSWKSGSTTTIGFEATPAQVACQAGDESGVGSESALSLPLALALWTGDGRVDSVLAGSLTTAAEGAGTSVLASRTCEGANLAEQIERCGLGDLDASGHTDLSLSLSATLNAGGVLRGSLDVLGVPVTNCQPTPNSSCGSPGSKSIETGLF